LLVIPTEVAGFFFRAVRGAPATERKDRGNPSTASQPADTSTLFSANLCALSASALSLLFLLNSSTPQLLNSSTLELPNSSTLELLNSSTLQLFNS